MTLEELKSKLDSIGIEWSLGEDMDGQVIVYTNLRLENHDDEEFLVSYEIE